MSKQGIMHLGYPEYFITMLVIFKVLGALTLILPQTPARLKEWAYAGFTFNIIAEVASNTIVDGLGFGTVFPSIILGVLAVSYYQFHKLMVAPRDSI